MPFVKGDPNINRNGRPKNSETDLLREALRKQGEKRGVDFWDKVAEYAFRDRQIMIAVLRKFIPDMTQPLIDQHTENHKHYTVDLTELIKEVSGNGRVNITRKNNLGGNGETKTDNLDSQGLRDPQIL